MKALFAPAIAVCARMRNIVKLPLIGAFFTLPLAIAAATGAIAWSSPAGWAVVATYAFAWYFMAGHLLAHDGTWDLINKVAKKLGNKPDSNADAVRGQLTPLAREEFVADLRSWGVPDRYAVQAGSLVEVR